VPPRGFFCKICKCTPITKLTPLFVLYEKVTEALRKYFGFDFHLFFSSLSPILSENMLTQGFWKFYESITEATEAIFQQNMEELAAQLLPP